jgi:hypothetical protein
MTSWSPTNFQRWAIVEVGGSTQLGAATVVERGAQLCASTSPNTPIEARIRKARITPSSHLAYTTPEARPEALRKTERNAG